MNELERGQRQRYGVPNGKSRYQNQNLPPLLERIDRAQRHHKQNVIVAAGIGYMVETQAEIYEEIVQGDEKVYGLWVDVGLYKFV